MRYKVRKGLESPCMIRGLLSGDYWIFVGCCSAAFVLFFLGIDVVHFQRAYFIAARSIFRQVKGQPVSYTHLTLPTIA